MINKTLCSAWVFAKHPRAIAEGATPPRVEIRTHSDAIFAAYGWKPALSDEEILEKLLAMNLERSKGELLDRESYFFVVQVDNVIIRKEM